MINLELVAAEGHWWKAVLPRKRFRANSNHSVRFSKQRIARLNCSLLSCRRATRQNPKKPLTWLASHWEFKAETFVKRPSCVAFICKILKLETTPKTSLIILNFYSSNESVRSSMFCFWQKAVQLTKSLSWCWSLTHLGLQVGQECRKTRPKATTSELLYTKRTFPLLEMFSHRFQ